MKKQKITALDVAVAQLVATLVDDLRGVYDFCEPLPRLGLNYEVSLRQGKFAGEGKLHGKVVNVAHTRITLVGHSDLNFIICDFYQHETTKDKGWIPSDGSYAVGLVTREFSCELNEKNGRITLYIKEG